MRYEKYKKSSEVMTFRTKPEKDTEFEGGMRRQTHLR